MGDSKELLETLTDKLNAIMKRRSKEENLLHIKHQAQGPKQSGLGPLPKDDDYDESDDDVYLDDELLKIAKLDVESKSETSEKDTSEKDTEPTIAQKAKETTSPASKGPLNIGVIATNVDNAGAKTTKPGAKRVAPPKTGKKAATAPKSGNQLKKPAAAVSSPSSKSFSTTTDGNAATKSTRILKKPASSPAKAGKVLVKKNTTSPETPASKNSIPNVDKNSTSAKKVVSSEELPNIPDADSIPFLRSILDDFGPEELEEFHKSDGTAMAEILHQDSTQQVENDLKDMQARLDESYKMFNNLSAQLDSISFSTLKDRIKELKLGDRNPDVATNLRQQFEESYNSNRLDQLTAEMSEAFKSHPGEFGDIPEISVFFKACTQFQNGINLLKKQQEETDSLVKRVSVATDASHDRIDVICKEMGIHEDENESDED